MPGQPGTAANEVRSCPDKLNDLIAELALANRILANEGVLDAFGHVSMRHPTDPGRYFLSRARSPLLIQPEDILEFTLDSEPVKPPKAHLYAERVIHGCIYQARQGCHGGVSSPRPAIMPFAIAGKPIVPVFHVGAAMGEDVPFWDQHDEFGDTNLLVVKPEEGRSLARALGHAFGGADEPPRRHGGRRRIEGAGVALDLHVPERRVSVARAGARPPRRRCISGETKLAGAISLMPSVIARTWEYWSLREGGGSAPRKRSKGKRKR